MFDPYPSISGSDSLYKQPLSSSGSMKAVMSRFQNKNQPALILQLKTTPAQDKIAIKNINKLISKNNGEWRLKSSNCADVGRTGARSGDYDDGISPISTPQELAQDLFESNEQAVTSGNIKVLKGNWKEYRDSSGSFRGIGGKVTDKVGGKINDLYNKAKDALTK